jgi:hypothetical protein
MEGEKLPTVSCAVEYQVKADKGLKRWLRLVSGPTTSLMRHQDEFSKQQPPRGVTIITRGFSTGDSEKNESVPEGRLRI